MPRRLALGTLAALCCALAMPVIAAPIPLEQIMAEPSWIGAPVEGSYWALDGGSVFYRLQRDSSAIRDLHRINVSDGVDRLVTPQELTDLDAPGAVFNTARTRAAFIRNGDVFVRDLATHRLTQVTRTVEAEGSPQFSRDERHVQYRRGMDWWAHELGSGLDVPLARVLASKDPDQKQPDDLEKMQLRLFETLREDRARREAVRSDSRTRQQADGTRPPEPIYLGEDADVAEAVLSPGGDWMLVVTTPKGADAGRVGKMPKYVTESGYEETEDVRTRVGRGLPVAHTLWRVDLTKRTVMKLGFSGLTGITDDPFLAIRLENEAAARARGDSLAAAKASAGAASKGAKPNAKAPSAPTAVERVVQVDNIVFSRDGAQAAVMVRAVDNKDRWIATVDPQGAGLSMQHRLLDPAWINWNFNDFGWLPDGRTLWYLSEESGYSHLYRKELTGKAVPLTSGRFEVSSPVLAPDARSFYFKSNAEAPYAYDVSRVPVTGGASERLTTLGTVERFQLSTDGKQLLLDHSAFYTPTQISIASAAARGVVRPLTDTRKPAYRAMRWIEPRIVGVPSSHVKAPIWSRLYAPADSASAGSLRPIVIFVHGAGYLQNTTRGYPYYFREQLFHNRLVEKGYVVLDMDYRASEGYGRDWRTAIYRQMGTPELEDLMDGVNWLVKEHRGDPSRVGLYGGSYGGFMTLMALFRAPEVFRAGAALRPVTDWTTYNHGYTSNILNTPQVDDVAYRRSSPIEYASGLQGSLLICHGMIDDNVLFQDSVRLWQRLIELHKDHVELAPYPTERHSFTHADSWLDEYKRIEHLFETQLR